jgi:hypothetical protein
VVDERRTDLAFEGGKSEGLSVDVVDRVLVDAHVLCLSWEATSKVLENREFLEGVEDCAEHE